MASDDVASIVPESDAGRETSEASGESPAIGYLEHRLEEAEERALATVLESEDETEQAVGKKPSSSDLAGPSETEFKRSESLMERKRLTQAWASKYTAEVEEYIGNVAEDQISIVEATRDFLSIIHEQKPEEQAERMNQISQVVENNEEAKPVIRDSGCVALIAHVMAVHRSSAAVQIAGCQLLELASEDSDSIQDKIGGWEGIDAVLDAMTTHRDDVEVQTASSAALRALTWAERNREAMLRHGAMQDLVRSMTIHLSNAKLQEHVSGTIAHVVFGNHDSKKMCGSVGGVKAISDAMRAHPDIVSLQAQCCFALRNLSWDCKENHALMHEDKTSDLIVHAMTRHPRIPGLQDQGLAALSNLMFRDMTTFEETIGDGEGKKALHGLAFGALQSFPKHVSIIRHAQSLLINLCDALRSQHSHIIARVARYPNAAKIICKTALVEGSVVEVPKNAARLMKVLCPRDDFLTEVRKNGGLEVLLSALQQFSESHPTDAAVIVEGLNAACSGSDESKNHFNEVGGVGTISELMHKVPNSEKFQERCCALLDIVSNGQFEATAISMSNRPEAMRAVLAAMVIYLDSATLQEHGCSVMIKVAASSEADSNDLCSAGAKPVVEKARTKHTGNPAVESLANQLLTLLVPSDDGNRERRGVTPRGNASSRLRSRSRTVQTGQRSRSRMDRSKSRERGGARGGGLAAVEEESIGDDALHAKPTRHAGSKPEKKGRRGGRAPITQSAFGSLDLVPE